MRPQPVSFSGSGGRPRLPKPGMAQAVTPVLFSRRIYLLVTLAVSVAFGVLVLPSAILPRKHASVAEVLLIFLNTVLLFQVQFGFHYLLRYSHNPVQRWLNQQSGRANRLLRVALVMLGTSLYSVGRYYLDRYLGIHLDNNSLGVLLAVVLIVAMVGASFQLAIEMVENSRYLTMENELLKREQLQARYESLKQQLSPHFLFNSLSTLGELIHDEPDAAELFVEKMAQVYRYLLHHGEQAAVPLHEELSFLRSYMYLLQMRFGEGIRLEINLPAAIQGRLVPPLALQLLLENAVKHNTVSRRQPLVIHLDFVGPATLRVRNTRSPRLTPEPSSGIGLSNLTNRVRLLNQQKLLVKPTAHEFLVYLPLPA
ncbi:MAG: hypothetical protein EOO62_19200 [Hymenobacter sp.]|nr:MAG: hypothetical protein EOO62_19200 [Hymenobacter sp.]